MGAISDCVSGEDLTLEWEKCWACFSSCQREVESGIRPLNFPLVIQAWMFPQRPQNNFFIHQFISSSIYLFICFSKNFSQAPSKHEHFSKHGECELRYLPPSEKWQPGQYNKKGPHALVNALRAMNDVCDQCLEEEALHQSRLRWTTRVIVARSGKHSQELTSPAKFRWMLGDCQTCGVESTMCVGWMQDGSESSVTLDLRVVRDGRGIA